MSNHLTNSEVNTSTVQLWYNKQRIKKNGCVSLYIQLIIQRESIEIPLKLEWPVKKIDWDKKQLLNRMPEDPDIVAFKVIIETARNQYWTIIKNFLLQGDQFTLSDVLRESNLRQDGIGICAYMRAAIKERLRTSISKEKIKKSTAKAQMVSVRKLESYLSPKLDYPLSRIDGDWLEGFADHLREEMEENSVYVKIKDVKAYLGFAFKKGIRVNLDYKRCIVSTEEPEIDPLDDDEFKRLIELYNDDERIGKYKIYLRGFLFACFTGLRISDLKRWNPEWLVDNGFKFIPTKTKASKNNPKPLFVPLIPTAKVFISSLSKDDTLGLPSDQEYNRGLKEIAERAGIAKRMSSHKARHFFGTSLAMKNVPVTMIANLMGHKNTNTTMRYINFAEKAKLQAMMHLEDAYGSSFSILSVSA